MPPAPRRQRNCTAAVRRLFVSFHAMGQEILRLRFAPRRMTAHEVSPRAARKGRICLKVFFWCRFLEGKRSLVTPTCTFTPLLKARNCSSRFAAFPGWIGASFTKTVSADRPRLRVDTDMPQGPGIRRHGEIDATAENTVRIPARRARLSRRLGSLNSAAPGDFLRTRWAMPAFFMLREIARNLVDSRQTGIKRLVALHVDDDFPLPQAPNAGGGLLDAVSAGGVDQPEVMTALAPRGTPPTRRCRASSASDESPAWPSLASERSMVCLQNRLAGQVPAAVCRAGGSKRNGPE